MVSLPRARPKPGRPPHPRPPEKIAIAVLPVDFGYRYAAIGELQSWSAFIPTPNKEAALLEAIARVRAEHGRHLRMRFLVNLEGSNGSSHHIWLVDRMFSDLGTTLGRCRGGDIATVPTRTVVALPVDRKRWRSLPTGKCANSESFGRQDCGDACWSENRPAEPGHQTSYRQVVFA